MSNPYAIYKANYINNLPSGVTYNSDIARFFYNGKSFFTPQAVESYRIYLNKFGLSGLSVAFGALTAAGEAAVPVNDSNIVEGNDLGHWQIVGNELSLSVAGAAAGQADTLLSSYRLVLLSGQEINIVTEAGAATVGNADELIRYLDPYVAGSHNWSAGGTIYLRHNDGTIYDLWQGAPSTSGSLMVDWFQAMGPTVIRSADPFNMAKTTSWLFQDNSQTVSGITLRELVIEQGELATNRPHHNLAAGRPLVEFGLNASDCHVQDCVIDGLVDDWIDGGICREIRQGVRFGPSSVNCSATDNEIRNIQTGISVRGQDVTCRGNEIHRISGGDWFSIDGSTVTGTLTLENNNGHTPIGDNDYRHGDLIQINGTGTPAATLVIRNNRFSVRFLGRTLAEQADGGGLGDRQVLLTTSAAVAADNANYTLVASDASGSYTLTDDDAYRDIRIAPLVGTTLTINLPPAASNNGKQWCCLRLASSGVADISGNVAFNLDGSDTHAASIPAFDSNSDTFTFRSNGTSQWQELQDQKSWMVPQTTDRTLTTAERLAMIYADTTSGNVTVTLPASPSDGDQYNVKRNHVVTGTVTVDLNGNSYFLNGSEISVDPTLGIGQHLRFRWDAANSRWAAARRSVSVQGMFTNGGAANMTFSGNVFLGNASNMFIFQQGCTNCDIFNNTFGRETETGKTFVGNSNVEVNGDGNIVFANVVMGSITLTGNSASYANTELADESASQTFFDAITFQTSTDAEAIALMRPANDNVFHGAYGATDATGYLNPTTFALNTLPAPTLTASQPADAGTLGTSESVVLTFDQPIASGASAALYVVGGGAFASSVGVDANVVTITPDSAFADATDYGVTTSSVVSEVYGTSYAGLSTGDLVFTAEQGALTVYPIVDFGTDITAPENYTGTYTPGGTQDGQKLVFAYRGRIDYDNAFAQIFRGANLEVRPRSNGQFYLKYQNGSFTRNSTMPAAGTDIDLYFTADLSQSNAVSAFTMVINGAAVDFTGTGYSTGRTVDLTGALDIFFSSVNSGRNFTGAHEITFLDQPATLPDITQASVRAQLDAQVIDAARGSGDWSATLTGRQPQICIYGDAADIQAGVNYGTGSFGTDNLWTPAELSGLQLWLDSSDSSSVTLNGSAVSQWSDLSGNGNHATQPNPSKQPTYGNRTVNGKNALDFTAGDYLETGFAPAINRTLAVVSLYDVSAGLKVILGARNSFNERSYIGVGEDPTRFAAGNVASASGNATSVNTPIIQVGYHNSSFELVHYFNGIKDIDTTFGGTIGSNQNYYVGGLNDGGTFLSSVALDGLVLAAVALDGVISDSDRLKLEGYFAHHFGITDNLAADHPYKDSAPTL